MVREHFTLLKKVDDLFITFSIRPIYFNCTRVYEKQFLHNITMIKHMSPFRHIHFIGDKSNLM